jgi:lipoprotein-releasing system permease protein
LLGFVLLVIGFIGIGFAHYQIISNLFSDSFNEPPVGLIILFLLLDIGYVLAFTVLFIKYYKSILLRILFALLCSLNGLGLPIILAIFLYKVALKKIPNIINLMSAISVFGVSMGTMALVIVLSIFNGFDDLIKALYNSFDPDLKVTVVEGKTFRPDHPILKKLSEIKGVTVYSEVIEESVLLKYGDKQYPATLKGVDDNYVKVNGIDTMVREGKFLLEDDKGMYAIVGQGIAFYLQVGLKFVTPLVVYYPRKDASISMNVEDAFNQKYIFPSGIFSMEQDHDAKYVIVPIKFAFELLEDSSSISAVEIRIAKTENLDDIQHSVQELFGKRFKVQNRYQQQELFYRIMKYEKWAIYMILAFILTVASFNILGSLSMLIIEKKKDISTFNSMGADLKLIRRTFLYEGIMISFFGALIGFILGLIVCWLQIKFGFIRLQGSGSFIIDTYPVAIRFGDIFLAFLTVLVIGYVAAWYPVTYIIRRYIPDNQQ